MRDVRKVDSQFFRGTRNSTSIGLITSIENPERQTPSINDTKKDKQTLDDKDTSALIGYETEERCAVR